MRSPLGMCCVVTLVACRRNEGSCLEIYVFQKATTGADARLWTDESGVLVAAPLAIVAVVIARAQWSMHRMPPSATAAGAAARHVAA